MKSNFTRATLLRSLFFLFLVLLATKTNAQFQDPQTYQLSFGISTYQPLAPTDSLLNRMDGKPCINCKGDFWSDDENDTSIHVPPFNLYDFDIHLYSQTYKVKEFPIAANYSGDVWFKDDIDPFKNDGYSRIAFHFQPLKDRGTKDNSVSPVRKKIEGIKPNRILKLEYRNAGFVADETNLDSINIQLWYIEADSSVEMHWGKCSVKNQALSSENEGKDRFFASFMIREPDSRSTTEFYEFLRPGGSVDSLYAITSDRVIPFRFEGVPYDGQYFRFSRKKATAGIGNKQLLAAEVFPNPSTGFIYVRGINHQQASTVKMYNLVGQLVLSQTLAPLEDVVDVRSLNKGMYVLHIEQNNKQYTTKIIKQ